ncbi:hypothetical protein BJ741DRAFT_340215 [Chytriomyces cf. hyalinus JEL632]|nr:hypothetical protein BJ741DRAFT_340215 [Chytriomyces cf. hyalinus JEL632]
MRSFAVLSVLLPLVAAHYAIFSPAPRDGTDEQTELIAPCGGLRLGARSNFPIKGGVITGDLAHPTATASFSIVVSETDPAPSQFGQVFVGPPPMSVLTLGSFSVPIDLSSIPQCVDGAAVTFQVVMQTADGTLYTCLDVVCTLFQLFVCSFNILPRGTLV